MASPQELRAKLLAQRAAQKEVLRLKEELHQDAIRATRNMIKLGYNFDDIADMAKNKVSTQHLSLIFKTIKCFRKRKSKAEKEREVFGASRWLEKPRNFTIELSSDDEYEPVEDSREPVKEPVKESLEPVGEPKKDLVDHTDDHTDDHVNHTSDHANQSVDDHLNKPTSDRANEPASDQVHDPVNDHSNEPASDQVNEPVNDHLNEPASDHSSKTVNEPANNDTKEPGNEPVDYSFISEYQPSDAMADDTVMEGSEEEDPMENMMEDSVTRMEQAEEADILPESHPVEHNVDHVASSAETEASPSVESMEVESSKSVDVSEKQVSQEIEKVKSMIREMQQKKLAREVHKEAEMELNRRSMELRDIAVKRALLDQSRQQHLVAVSSLTNKVARLEKSLAIERSNLNQAKQELAGIGTQKTDLEAQEMRLREELSRPRIIVPTKQSSMSEDKAQPEEASRAEPASENMPNSNILTVADSPLRMFSSFRMCPNYGPKLWFSKSFNGRFVKDLNVRTLCPTELKPQNTHCKNPTCSHVHFSDFEVDPKQVCQYMATRKVGDKEFMTSLHDTIVSRLKDKNVPPAQIAAVIIGCNKMYRPNQILDWDSWDLEYEL